MFLDELTDSINRIKGIGIEASKDLANLGVYDIKSLLKHYPVKWEDRKKSCSIKSGLKNGYINTIVTIEEHSYIGFGAKKTLKILAKDNSGYISLLCFGRKFLETKLTVGQCFYLFSSNIQYKFSEIQCSSFEFERYEENKKPKQFDTILPIYRLSGKLTQNNLRKFIKSAISVYCTSIDNEIPESILKKYNLVQKQKALSLIHFPNSQEEIKISQQSLIFEELFHLSMISGKKILKNSMHNKQSKDLPKSYMQRVINKLPFDLTKDQVRAIDDIINDLNSSKKMNRLIQGDVGSGKTLVAFLSALPVIEAGGQVALMAPTELLAKQHSEKAYELLHSIGIKTAFISGNTKSNSRQLLLTELKQGNIDLLIGTHALFTEDVIYKQLDLIIIDEQHRFGVNQRLSIRNKGDNPDLLLMTATPIPRTLTLTIFGDLDISTIKTMPHGRKPIETHLARIGNEKKVYDFIFKELQKGRQAYFVYPLIEQSDKINIKDAESMYLSLKKTFSGYNIGIIHSRLDEDLKESTMTKFCNGELDILVSTSVVEVGVDVQNATVMIIEHAERFGLSALHQLRGRVGRGNHQSYCFLIYSNMLTEEAKQRLLIMKDTNDGFIISTEDLKIRGPGDIAGIKQSGFMKFSIANLIRDEAIVEITRKEAYNYLKQDPGLISADSKHLRDLYRKVPPFTDNFIAFG